jgi:parallel beta-helix repeat protein
MAFEFTPANGYEDAVTFPDPPTEAAARTQVMNLHRQMRDAFNEHLADKVHFINPMNAPYNCVFDDVADDYLGLSAAADVAIALGVPLLIPGKCYISQGLNKTGKLSIMGYGVNSCIRSGDLANPVLKIQSADGITLENFKLLAAGIARDSTNDALYLGNCTRFKVDNIFCEGTEATGIFIVDCHNGKIKGCDVRNTLADGIHITGSSYNIEVQECHVESVGDDGIACVSYLAYGNRVKNVRVVNNEIIDTGARGLSNIGSENIQFVVNNIDGTEAAGIIIAQEVSYQTFGAKTSIISGNIIKKSCLTVDHASILVTQNYYDAARAGDDTRLNGGDIIITDNIIDASENGFNKQGLMIDNSDNVTVKGNRVLNGVWGCRVGHFANPSSTRRINDITFIENYYNQCTQPEFNYVDNLVLRNNKFFKTTPYAGRHLNVLLCRYAVIDGNRVTDTAGADGTLKCESLFRSIVGYNLCSIGFASLTDQNPYDSSYEWYNKIMESKGVTIPVVSALVANDRYGKVGTATIEGAYPNYKLKVRIGTNDFAYVNLTL